MFDVLLILNKTSIKPKYHFDLVVLQCWRGHIVIEDTWARFLNAPSLQQKKNYCQLHQENVETLGLKRKITVIMIIIHLNVERTWMGEDQEDQMKMKQGQPASTTSKYQRGCFAMWLKILITKKQPHRVVFAVAGRQAQVVATAQLTGTIIVTNKKAMGMGAEKREDNYKRLVFEDHVGIMQTPQTCILYDISSFTPKLGHPNPKAFIVLRRW